MNKRKWYCFRKLFYNGSTLKIEVCSHYVFVILTVRKIADCLVIYAFMERLGSRERETETGKARLKEGKEKMTEKLEKGNKEREERMEEDEGRWGRGSGEECLRMIKEGRNREPEQRNERCKSSQLITKLNFTFWKTLAGDITLFAC